MATSKEKKPHSAAPPDKGPDKGKDKGKDQAKGKGKDKAAQPEAQTPASKPGNAGPARLKEHYLKEVVPVLTKEFGYTNIMAVPKIKKISINIGLGEATQNPRMLDAAVTELSAIAGQKPVITKAKKSIAQFKLRENMAIGCMLTLRGDRMYQFLDRLANIALARVRDFRGISSKSFDGRGNYTLGLKEQLIFPEIDYNKVDKVKGMNICITTSAKTDAEGLALLKAMGMPFRQ